MLDRPARSFLWRRCEDMESFDKALWKSFLALNNAYAEVITNHGAFSAGYGSFYQFLSVLVGPVERWGFQWVLFEELKSATYGLGPLAPDKIDLTT